MVYSYVRDFAERYEENMCTLLQNVNLDQYPHFNIFSIGCGAAPDLAAFEKLAEKKPIFYAGCDKNTLWKKTHNAIEKYSESKSNISAILNQCDIFDVFADSGQIQRSYNVVVIQYLISHLHNTKQSGRIYEFYKGIIDDIVCRRDALLPFLIIINDIDTYKKGRNLFYKLIDALEDNGYSGRATAYSSWANGDLGKTRWGGNKIRAGTIEYSYKTPPIGLNKSAALVIELNGGSRL